jgi:cellobiose-specific phosphotransferase system component IIA
MNVSEKHIRDVFFGLPITVVHAEDQLMMMQAPPEIIEAIMSVVKKARERSERNDGQVGC